MNMHTLDKDIPFIPLDKLNGPAIQLILSTILESNTKSKSKQMQKLSYHLGGKYSNDPGSILICQLRKYIEELHKKFTKLFKDNPPKDLETLLVKIDLPSVYLMIMKILITKGNPTLMPKGATDEN